MNQTPENKGILRSLNGDGRHGLWLIVALAALLLPLLGGEPLRDALRYDRSAIAAGQWWRLASAHVVHLDAAHAALNAAGLVLLWGLFARSYRARAWWFAIALAVVTIGAGFWWLEPQLQWYVGASGVLHGVFACGCVAMLIRREPIGFVAASIFIAKLLWEHWQGPLPFETDAPVITAAHLYGAIGGGIAGLLLAVRVEAIIREQQ